MKANFKIWSNEIPIDENIRQDYRDLWDEIYEETDGKGEDLSDYDLDMFIAKELGIDYDTELENISWHEKEHGIKTYVVVASLGLWNGTFDGGKIITGMTETIQKCIDNMDYIDIFYKNNQMCIKCVHHDGTNMFYIRELTTAGREYAEKHEWDMDERTLHQRLFTSSRYSHKVSLFPDMYGC